MARREDFPWGRWIRVNVAHHYLSVDRRFFNEHVRPHVRVLTISKQAKAIPREDIDAWAAAFEGQHHTAPVAIRAGRASVLPSGDNESP